MSLGTHFGEKLWGQGAQDGELRSWRGITEIFRYLKYSTEFNRMQIKSLYGFGGLFGFSFPVSQSGQLTQSTDPDSVEWAGA